VGGRALGASSIDAAGASAAEAADDAGAESLSGSFAAFAALGGGSGLWRGCSVGAAAPLGGSALSAVNGADA